MKELKITIPLGSVIDAAACKITGHKWGQWTMHADDIQMTRTCDRCGATEKADVPQPK